MAAVSSAVLCHEHMTKAVCVPTERHLNAQQIAFVVSGYKQSRAIRAGSVAGQGRPATYDELKYE
jgi:hypothetical protein